MSERFCCAECFGDAQLRANIEKEFSPTTGVCDYCGSSVETLIRPSVLGEAFEALVGIYEVSDEGLSLPAILRRDWGLFTHPVLQDDAHAKELIGDILDDGELPRKLFAPPSSNQAESLAQWDDLRAEMMHGNRWFLSERIDYERLRELLSYLITDPAEISDTWHRARIMSDDEPYPIEKMGAPPPRYAGHGRANPAGIPYLYLGSDPKTAVAEIRPHTGDAACVAEFTIPSMRAVDLRAPRTRVSPFGLNDDEARQMHADLPFLERLGEELTRPVLPHGAPFEYVPSQHLCEFIKHCGFDGVIYRSSVSTGVNVALFRPEVATGGQVHRYLVERVEVYVAPRP